MIILVMMCITIKPIRGVVYQNIIQYILTKIIKHIIPRVIEVIGRRENGIK